MGGRVSECMSGWIMGSVCVCLSFSQDLLLSTGPWPYAHCPGRSSVSAGHRRLPAFLAFVLQMFALLESRVCAEEVKGRSLNSVPRKQREERRGRARPLCPQQIWVTRFPGARVVGASGRQCCGAGRGGQTCRVTWDILGLLA